MNCSAARTFLSQLSDRTDAVAPIPPTDLQYLTANGYVSATSKSDYDSGAAELARLSQISAQLDAERAEEQQENAALQRDQQKEHSFVFHFEGKQEKDELRARVANEAALVSKEQSELSALDAHVNELIQKKSTMDRMVPYEGEYLAITGLGTLVLSDLNVRNYRVAEEDFADFLSEIKSVYAELRSIAERASYYVNLLKPVVPKVEEEEGQAASPAQVTSLLWSVAIGLAKLQGDPNEIYQRFAQAYNVLRKFDSTTPNRLMAAEIMTAVAGQDVQGLEAALKNLDHQLRDQGVPKELSAGIAATIMAGRRYDGSYPLDRFSQFRQSTLSYESAAILAVMNEPFDALNAEFQTFRAMLTSWGFMTSEDTEISSAFLAIGELKPIEVEEKLKYIVEQLKNYLEYPLVASAILASIPVFEAHEVLDLMEKAVTLLSAYATGFERSELVALAVRMIHGVRNELVKQIDPAAKTAPTPVQFTYATHPGFFMWYFPVIVAHSSYHATFSGMGGFHPAHSHGVGGFAG